MTAVPDLAAWLRGAVEGDLAWYRTTAGGEASDAQERIARCEAELAILDEHAIVHRDIGWQEDGSEEYAEIPVCGSCVPKHSHFRSRADVPEGPCRTARLLGSGYRHRAGYLEEWAP